MAINSVAGITAAINAGKFYKQYWQKTENATALAAGNWYTLWTLPGMPSAGAYGGTANNLFTMTGSGASPTAGKFYAGEAVSPSIKQLIGLEAGIATVATTGPLYLILVDMLMYYAAFPLTSSPQTMVQNSNSLPRYTSGAGVMAFLEITTVSSATAWSFTITYTNQSGSGSKTSVSMSTPATATILTQIPYAVASGTAAAQGPFITLAAGDYGIQSVQSMTITSPPAAGNAALVLCKPLAAIPINNANINTARDFIFNIPTMPVIQDGACLNFLLFSGAAFSASAPFNGILDFVWG